MGNVDKRCDRMMSSLLVHIIDKYQYLVHKNDAKKILKIMNNTNSKNDVDVQNNNTEESQPVSIINDNDS